MSKRRKNDFYETPSSITQHLLNYWTPTGTVIEPCNGDGAISTLLKSKGIAVMTNDIDPARNAHHTLDAKLPTLYETYPNSSVITNPPFNEAFPIVKEIVDRGMPAAFLLRLSFLEPTYERGEWLAKNPPNSIIVTPRISFTGDGKCDSSTTAWFLWNQVGQRGISIIPKIKK